MKVTFLNNSAASNTQQVPLNNSYNNTQQTKTSTEKSTSSSKMKKVLYTGAGALASYGMFSLIISKLEKAKASRLKTIGVLTAAGAAACALIIGIAYKIRAKAKKQEE